jgi:hypothetical protein
LDSIPFVLIRVIRVIRVIRGSQSPQPAGRGFSPRITRIYTNNRKGSRCDLDSIPSVLIRGIRVIRGSQSPHRAGRGSVHESHEFTRIIAREAGAIYIPFPLS